MKLCPTCQTENEDEVMFCNTCGTKLSQAEAENVETADAAVKEPEAVQSAAEPAPSPAQDKKKFPVKAIVSVVLILAIIAALVAVFRSGGTADQALVISNDDAGFVLFNNKKAVQINDMSTSIPSPDMKAIAYYLDDDDDTYYYLASGDKSGTKIAENISTIWFSLDGKYMYYLTYDDELFEVKSGKSGGTKIDSEVTGISSISPSKQRILYSKENESKYYLNGEKTDLSVEDIGILFISDKDYIVYSKNDKYYIAKNGSDSVTLSSDSFHISFTNKTGSEILFEKDSGLFLTVNGKEPEKIVKGSSASLIKPLNSASMYARNSSTVSASKTLIGEYFISENKLYKLGKNEDKTKLILSKVSAATLSEDGSTLMYYKNDKYYITTKFSKEIDSDEALLNGDEIKDVSFSADLAKIYYTDEDGALYYRKTSSSKAEKIANDCDGLLSNLLIDGTTCYYVCDDVVYMSKNGSSPKKVEGISGDAAYGAPFYDFAILKTDEYYYKIDGKKATKICDA